MQDAAARRRSRAERQRGRRRAAREGPGSRACRGAWRDRGASTNDGIGHPFQARETCSAAAGRHVPRSTASRRVMMLTLPGAARPCPLRTLPRGAALSRRGAAARRRRGTRARHPRRSGRARPRGDRIVSEEHRAVHRRRHDQPVEVGSGELRVVRMEQSASGQALEGVGKRAVLRPAPRS